MTKDSKGYSFICGIILGLICFISYSLLVLGVFMVIYAIFFLSRKPQERLVILIRHTFIILAIPAVLYSILWFYSEFNPIATLISALDNQAIFSENMIPKRPYPHTIIFDILDFALGSGWISFLLVFFLIIKRTFNKRDYDFWIACFCLIQIFIVAIVGILPAETARVWIFMLPLLMFPIGMELSTWNFSKRMGLFFSIWFLLTAINQNMQIE